MMHVRRQFCLAVALIALPQASLFAEEAPGGIDPSLIIEQFDVFTDGDSLLVPVDISGKRYPFVVDTGYTFSGYDKSLRPLLGDARGAKLTGAPTGVIRVDLHSPPNARLGKMNLHSRTPVGCLDYQKMREVSGHDFYGVIGMDVLSDHVVRLDSDHGKLMTLRSPGTALGNVLPLTYSEHVPLVAIDIPSCGKLPFMIDTGLVVQGSGMLDARTFEYSVMSGVGKQVAKSLFTDVTGKRTSREVGFLEKVFLGKCECRTLVMDQPKQGKYLSLRFLTRFNVTFDFREDRIYLEKSRYFNRPDRCDLSGLHFLRRNGQVLIESIDDGSPAALGGCKPGDIILNLNGQDASQARLFTMRETLSLPGTTVHLKLRQGNDVAAVELKLPKPERLTDARYDKSPIRSN